MREPHVARVDAIGLPGFAAPAIATEQHASLFRIVRLSLICLIGSTFGATILPLSAASLLLLPMTADLGWSRAEYLFGGSLLLWGSAVSMPLAGRLGDRLGARTVIVVGTALLAVMVFGLSRVGRELLPFYALMFGAGMCGSVAICYTKVVAMLFTKHRGKAIGLFGVETTFASAAIPLMTNWMLGMPGGWRSVFQLFAVLLLAIAGAAWLMLEEPAVEIGHAAGATPASAVSGHSLGEALADRNFWLLVGAMMVAMLLAAGLTLNLVPAIVEKGFSQNVAAGVMALFMLTGLLGTVAAGFAADHVGSARVAVPFFLLSALAALLLWFVTARHGGYPLLLAVIVLHGSTFIAQRPLAIYLLSRFFGMRSFNQINGIFSAIQAGLMGFGPFIVGLIYDANHTYAPVYIGVAISAVVAAGLIALTGDYKYSVEGHGLVTEP